MLGKPLTAYPVNGVSVKLGRQTPSAKRLTLNLADYARRGLPAPPDKCDYFSGVPRFPMYYNHVLGCCVASTVGHMLGLWSALASPPEVLFTDEQIVAFYSAVGGYNPRYPWTDQGLVIADALTYACKPGSLLDNDTTLGFAEIRVGDALDPLLSACEIFGGVHFGVGLPAAWQSQTGPGRVWDVGSGRGYEFNSWGGHSVPLVGYNKATKRGTVVTWGALQEISFAAISRYVDEAYVLVDSRWVSAGRPTPHGVDLAALVADFRELGGPPIPIPDPPLPPTPPTPPVDGSITIDLAGRLVTVPANWRVK